ncbi:ABC transporter substrate-binding protein, partial [Acinetobacter baumannii]
ANALEGLPYKIEWSQFPAAAPLLEALNAGALDVGFTGEIPFLFVYAAGAPIRVIGASRSLPASNAVLVPRKSPARSFADLRGKRIAVNRG